MKLIKELVPENPTLAQIVMSLMPLCDMANYFTNLGLISPEKDQYEVDEINQLNCCLYTEAKYNITSNFIKDNGNKEFIALILNLSSELIPEILRAINLHLINKNELEREGMETFYSNIKRLEAKTYWHTLSEEEVYNIAEKCGYNVSATSFIRVLLIEEVIDTTCEYLLLPHKFQFTLLENLDAIDTSFICVTHNIDCINKNKYERINAIKEYQLNLPASFQMFKEDI